MHKILEDVCLCYHMTSISSYSVQHQAVRFDYNQNIEPLPQMRLGKVRGCQEPEYVFTRNQVTSFLKKSDGPLRDF